jgi:leukotriene-A4 hydrolase
MIRITLKAILSGDLIILDSKNLNIQSIVDSKTGNPLQYKLDKDHEIESLGTPLKILLGYTYKPGDRVEILINYTSSPDSLATQWCTKEMTLGKEHPFMYTQGEAILNRSLIPCQDTPAAKVTVSASLKVKKPLVAVYSGIKVREQEDGDSTIYFYEQKIPVASYLIAIAAGVIEGRKLNERTTVYAEKEIVDKAAWEFADTEKFIEAAEAYLTPYEWGQYNILVLPPGFPYGGMENPTLTFVTPALIAGDRSLANVIAHEIAHSWTGNLVTNSNWRSFWLNEGFTVFIERKISQMIYGNEIRKLSSNIGYTDLLDAIKFLGATDSFTSLYPNIEHVLNF